MVLGQTITEDIINQVKTSCRNYQLQCDRAKKMKIDYYGANIASGYYFYITVKGLLSANLSGNKLILLLYH